MNRIPLMSYLNNGKYNPFFTLTSFFVLVVILSCSGQPKEFDLIQNYYDPLMSAKQREYRLWLEEQETKTVLLFEAAEFKSTEEVTELIKYYRDSHLGTY